MEKNIALKMAGAVLHASNIRLEAVHRRPGGKEKETFNSKKVDEIRIAFDIDENYIAENGTKQIYVRVIAPHNRILYSNASSGIMHTVKEGELTFSLMKEIDLVKNEPLKNVVVEWMQRETYSGGLYKIELYNGGYKIGEGGIKLK